MSASNPVMPQIQTVVHLMLENRSLDNLLGWLYSSASPQHYYPPSNTAAYDGLVVGGFSNPFDGMSGLEDYPVTPIPVANEKKRIPAFDPYEAMVEGSDWKGVINQMYGDQDTTFGLPGTGAVPGMKGFLQDYYASYMVDAEGLDILWTFSTTQAPNINTLAAQFGVSDRWFSSVPTQTNPNRAYSLCGTSLGREANASYTAVEQFDVPTLFNALGNAGKRWGLYYHHHWQDHQCYTQYTFPQLGSAPHGEIDKLKKFFKHAKEGTLPDFTYIEPKWGYGSGILYFQGDDYHPPTHIDDGEKFLLEVFNALRSSPQWDNMLLVVTFDEHGGTYDHAAPPWGAINPDGIIGTKWGFNFQQYGARVPTLLISPYVAPGTVFREPTGSAQPYDHTSFIKTMLLWAGVDPTTAGLGNRVIAAPSFDGVLSSTVVNTYGAGLADDAALEPPPTPEVGTAPEYTGITVASATALDEDLFEGIGFASVRMIIHHSESLDDVHAWIAKYRANPGAFEAALASGTMPA